MSNSEYLLDGAKLFHKGKQIGVLEEDEIKFTAPEHQSHKVPVTKWLAEEAKRLEELEKERVKAEREKKAKEGAGDGSLPGLGGPGAGVAGSVAAPAAPVLVQLSEQDKQAKEAESLAAEGRRGIAAYQADLMEDQQFYAENKGRGCPPVPKKNPAQGDKTPLYVEWLSQWRPDKFAAKFGVAGPGRVPVEVKNAAGEPETRYEEVTLANRKTHLTHKLQDGGTLTADQSWDA